MRVKRDMLIYSWRNACISFWRNGLMSSAAVTTIAVMLALLSFFVVGIISLQVSLKFLQSRMDLIAYVKDDALPSQVLNLRTRLEHDSHIHLVTYVSKEEALQRLKEQLHDRPDLVKGIKDNPLPASLEMQLDDINYQPQLAASLKNEVVIDKVDYRKAVVQRLIAIVNFFQVAGLATTIGLVLMTLFIIVNSIRVAVFSRRSEIEIMKLVGASDWFVRWPFIFEGVLYGLTGAAIASLAVAFSFQPAMNHLTQLLPFLPLAADPFFVVKLIALMIAGGISVGGLGSYIAVRRFLEV